MTYSNGSELLAPFNRTFREVAFAGQTYLLGDYSEAERQQLVAQWAEDATKFGAAAKLSKDDLDTLIRARLLQVCLFATREQRALPTDHATTVALSKGSAGRFQTLSAAVSELLNGTPKNSEPTPNADLPTA